jgi:branched-chain amino acid transport system ATP-binding protein
MLAVARALSADPAVVIVDELSLGLAPAVARELYQAVATTAHRGAAVLLVEQFAPAALEVAHRGVVMAGGVVVAEGHPHHIATQLTERYLGAHR